MDMKEPQSISFAALNAVLCRIFWRKVRDLNPRTLAGLQFSRLVPSTSLPTFRVKIADFSAIFYSVLRFYKFWPLDLQFVEKFVEILVATDDL